MKENIQNIITYIKEVIGVNPQSMSPKIWKNAIYERMKACGISDETLYYHTLRDSAHELQELIELIVVPETWFFRDKSAFDFLSSYINKWLTKKSPREKLNVLSLPCSTGEEPYSIAMTLLKLGLPEKFYTIEAVDISLNALKKAQKGLYGHYSFRGKDLSFRYYFFEKENHDYQINKELFKQVIFKYGNVFDSRFYEALGYFHLIFCRNLIIYLHEEAQIKLLKILQTHLLEDGMVFVGPAETEVMRRFGYIQDQDQKACAFHKPAPATKQKKIIPKPPPDIKNLKYSPSQSLDAHISLKRKKYTLEEARQLADMGQFEEASSLCDALLKEGEPDPEVYFLLGLIQHAYGNEHNAENFFLKTLYLKPDHYEALVYLALLAKKRGDIKQADLYLGRADRIMTMRQ